MLGTHLTVETEDEDSQYSPIKEVLTSRHNKRRSNGSLMSTRSSKIFDRVDGDNNSPQHIFASSRASMCSP